MDFLKNITIRKYWWLKLLWNLKDTFLYESGWIESFRKKRALTVEGENIPWVSYALYRLLDDRLSNDNKIFEYGLGSSSLYFNNKVDHLYGVENNEEWYKEVTSKMDRKNFILAPVGENYIRSIRKLNLKFDLVIVDGRMRVDCISEGVNWLSQSGVLILDDSHRNRYEPAYEIMNALGFKHLDLWGFGNGSIELKSSTIFYKESNILGI